jgi:hypothetical protein
MVDLHIIGLTLAGCDRLIQFTDERSALLCNHFARNLKVMYVHDSDLQSHTLVKEYIG